MAFCYKCGSLLCNDEVGLNKKLISRGITKFLCFGCLSKHFDCSAELLKQKVQEFRDYGCVLFPK